jgi:hypothetical protein
MLVASFVFYFMSYIAIGATCQEARDASDLQAEEGPLIQ